MNQKQRNRIRSGWEAKRSARIKYKPKKESGNGFTTDHYGTEYARDIRGVIRRAGLKAPKVPRLRQPVA